MHEKQDHAWSGGTTRQDSLLITLFFSCFITPNTCGVLKSRAAMHLTFTFSTSIARIVRRQTRATPLSSSPPKTASCAANFSNPAYKLPLLRGVVMGRPNRFIFRAIIPSLSPHEVEAHSPAVGNIGALAFSAAAPVRALLSEAVGPGAKKRRTKYTVEALDIGAGGEGDAPVFCGINQTKSNEYLAFFLKSGTLTKIVPRGCEIRREVGDPDGNSRIDIVATTGGGKKIWVSFLVGFISCCFICGSNEIENVLRITLLTFRMFRLLFFTALY